VVSISFNFSPKKGNAEIHHQGTKAPRHQGTKTPRKGRKLIVLVLRVVLVAARNNKKSRGFLPWPEIREALIAGGNQLPTDCVPR
jgi:hypothetical protein